MTPEISPAGLVRSVYAHRALALALIRREVASRYRGSYLGVVWSVLNPLAMLAAYTFAFSIVFEARWPGGSGGRVEFAIAVFLGQLVFGFFSECMTRSPLLVVSNANYVKKVVFPLELLVPVAIGTATFHFILGMLAWLAVLSLFGGMWHSSMWLLPLLMFPLLLIMAGASWFFAALGVYLRDIAQVMGFAMTFLMFVSPVFYPIAAVPAPFRPLVELNPIGIVIEQTRAVAIAGRWPDWWTVLGLTIGGSIVCYAGFLFFQKARKGFADVL